jgi:Tfp pilus assembly protein PilW
LGTMLTAAFSIFSSGLQTKHSEDLKLGVQQNLRAAMEVISQDLRSAGVMHLYNQTACTSSKACSNSTQVSVLGLTGESTAITTTPGTNTNATSTAVCDSTGFNVGNLVIRYNGSAINANATLNALNLGFNRARLLTLTAVAQRPTPASPCATGSNEATLTHAGTSLIEQIDPNGQSYVFKATLNTYMLEADPVTTGKTALYRRSGLDATNPKVVAYGLKPGGIKIEYGVRDNEDSSSASKIKFYDTLALAATAATAHVTGTGPRTYVDVPTTSATDTYIGGAITAVRITLDGESDNNLPGSSEPAKFSLTQTVDLRN